MNKDTTLFKLPNGWLWTVLGELGIVVSGGTPSTKEPRFWSGEIAWVTPADLSNYKDKFISKGYRNISELGLEYSSAVLLPQGSLLFSSRAPIGYTAIAKNALATNQGFKSLIPVKSTHINYLYYYLLSAKQIIASMASGTTFPELSSTNFNKIPVPLAPLNEQYRIVQKIEELFSELDKSVTTLNTAKKQLKIYCSTLLQSAFKGKLTKEWRLQNKTQSAKKLLEVIESDLQKKFKVHLEAWEHEMSIWKSNGQKGEKPKKPRLRKKISPLSRIELNGLSELPDGWIWVQVDDLLEFGRDCAYGVVQPGQHIDNGIKLIRIGDINNGVIRQDGLKRISLAIANKHKRTFLKGGEVLISLVGAIGRTAVVPQSLEGANIARAVGVMPISNLINPSYYELFFRQPDKIKEMTLLAHEVARKTLNIEDVRKATVALCCREEQDKIANIISYQFSIVESLETVIVDTLKQLESLKQGILKKAFEGSLVEQIENDESAKDVLNRINTEIREYSTQQKNLIKSKPKKMELGNKELSIVEVLKTSKTPLPAKTVWEQSKYKNDVETFYAELKKVQDQIKEVEKGFLTLIK